jgi:class 3 adenylate cyclase
VFANELIGTGPAQQTEVFGQVPYLAARLKNVAKPNTLVVASSTHDRVCKRFESKDLGNWKLKGFEEPVQAWQITRQKVIENLCETKCAPYGTVIRRPHKTDLKINQKEGYL